jgi:serine protease SohB
MEWLIEIGLFSGKALVIVIAIVVTLLAFFSLLLKAKPQRQTLNLEDLAKKFETYNKQIRSMTEDHKLLKKEFKKKEKTLKKKKSTEKYNIYVLDFDGDIKASAAEHLRDEITSILSVAHPEKDEVVVRLESTGGMVHAYGFAASQLQRVKDSKVKLTICVDKVAASGGYMMACTADHILAAPFAIIGSIGVLAQVPNFNRLLKRHDVDYEEITAGEYKRTISMFGEITEKGKQKFLQQIEETHLLFKDFVSSQRPKLDIALVATGEFWYGHQAQKLGLVDQLITSDSYLFSKKDEAHLIKISLTQKKNFSEKISGLIELSVTKIMDRWVQKNQESQLLR